MSRSSQVTPKMNLPFDGLGFDLSDVILAGSNLSLRIVVISSVVETPVLTRPRVVSGYGLLLELSREIRGS